MTRIPDETRFELAPEGRLRVALNYANFLLVTSRAPEPEGLAPDLSRELARRVGARLEFRGYENAGIAADAVRDNAWDIGFFANEPDRARDIAFTAAYAEIEATCLLPPGSRFRHLEELDQEGVRIATAARAAYTLYLRRTLRNARLVEVDGIQGSFELFNAGGFDALAGLKPRLVADSLRLPGSRLLDGRFTAIQQAIGAPRSRPSALVYLNGFVEDIKRSGLLADLMSRHAADGFRIAAPTTHPDQEEG